MTEYTNQELKDALRFMETCEDNEGYDVPKERMKRLATLGLVKHCGGGYYEATDKLQELLND